MQAEIAQLRTQLLHADQARELVENQLAEEKEERERAQRKVRLPVQPDFSLSIGLPDGFSALIACAQDTGKVQIRGAPADIGFSGSSWRLIVSSPLRRWIT